MYNFDRTKYNYGAGLEVNKNARLQVYYVVKVYFKNV